MAALNNSIIESMTRRASQPIQYQPNTIGQQPMAQPIQRPNQPYTHSFNNAPVMRDGVQYGGTHTMTFGNKQTAQSLGSGIAQDQRYSAPVQQQQGYQSPNPRINGILSMLQSGRDRLSERAELAMQRTVIPMANRKNAMGMLNLAMDYNNKQQAMDDQRNYQNSMVGVQQEQNRISSDQQKAQANYWINSLTAKGTQQRAKPIDPMKAVLDRNKIMETMVQSAPQYLDQEANTQAMIKAEYLHNGRLPHRYWEDNGVMRPVYYKQGGAAAPQQQQNEKWVTR